MLSKGFKIVSPKTFEIYYQNVELKNHEALVKIEYGAICKADLRYFLGLREERILGLKYPMRLLHEVSGTILKDPTNTFSIGERVVLVPNIAICESCDEISKGCNLKATVGENYCPKAKFASSNLDGFSCEYINFPVSNIVRLPEDISMEEGVFSELTSVAVAALRRCNLENKNTIGIWGDGVVGYILTAILKILIDKEENNTTRLVAIGKNQEKLRMFPVDKTYIAGDENLKYEDIDLAFECVGGQGSQYAINEIIDLIKIGGNIVLTGVAENNIEINTRKILEKAIIITGSTRSSVEDFKKAVELLENPQYRKYIGKLIKKVVSIKNIHHYYQVFDEEALNIGLGKILLKFTI